MTGTTKKLFDEAMALPAKERQALGEALIESAAAPGEIDEAWRQEVLRRIESVRSGEVETVPFSTVQRRIREALAR